MISTDRRFRFYWNLSKLVQSRGESEQSDRAIKLAGGDADECN